MEFIRKLILALILMTQISCITLFSVALTPLKPNCDKEKIMIKNTKVRKDIETNGFYISESNGLFFIYNNGLFCQYGSFDPEYNEYINDKERILNKLRGDILKSKGVGFWGEWNKTDSLITLRYFAYRNYGFCKSAVIGMDGEVLNDSTISVLVKYEFKDGIPVFFDNFSKKKYHFKSYDLKPDSSEAWFLDKKWYKKRIK